MNSWEELVQKTHIPTDPAKKLQYNAELLVNSAVVQAYDDSSFVRLDGWMLLYVWA